MEDRYMFEDGTYEYGLKTGDLPEKEMVKIFDGIYPVIFMFHNGMSKVSKKIQVKKTFFYYQIIYEIREKISIILITAG